MRVTGKPHVDSSKRDRVRDTSTFAKGGKGPLNRMLDEVPAETAPAGETGPPRVKAPGKPFAKGGRKFTGYGLALPAVAGHTAPLRRGRGDD
jgi:hypothetical protein